MPQRITGRLAKDYSIQAAVKDALHDMEPELRHLEGIVALLTILGEAQESIEPAALSALARSVRESSEVLSTGWRTAFEGLREP